MTPYSARPAQELELVVIECTLDPTTAGILQTKAHIADRRSDVVQLDPEDSRWQPQQREDCAMVLHTSGSTGNKKVVPHTVEDLLIGAVAIASACQLTPKDVCCNQMPLFHIGGIARNVLAPILSGGSVVCMPYFEPKLFWTVASDFSCTWYYAGPTMHTMILEAYKAFPAPRPRISLRFIANAAGPILPTIAEEMRDTYSAAAGGFCSIMPSYGMTECMPISSPPVGYNLDRPGSSGQIVGPRCTIRDAASGDEAPSGTVGEICVSGHPVMRAYENNPEETAKNFIGPGKAWFKTGDLGYLDEDGYLYVTGRSKEVINRGGEIIAPSEIENALVSHPRVRSLVAFSTPHALLQETIGVCVVSEPGMPRVGLQGLQAHAALELHPSKWPQLVVYASDLPKTATGKAMRVRLDKRMALPEISDETPERGRLFEAEMVPPGAPVQAPIPTAPLEVRLPDAEAAMRSLPGVDDAYVCERELEGGRRSIVGYVSPAAVDAEQVLAALAGSLHEYLVPARVVPTDALVRGSDGAVNQALLPEMRPVHSHVAPRTDRERAVQKLWCAVLGTREEDTSMDADFFFSGGSSLLAGTLAGEVKSQLGMPMSGTTLFKLRTIAEIAEAVETHHRQKDLEKATLAREPRSDLEKDGPLARLARFATMRAGGTPRDPSDLAERGGLHEESEMLASGAPAKPPKPQRPVSQHSFLPLFVQSLPLLFFHPLRRLASWALFLALWLTMMDPAPVFIYLSPQQLFETEEWVREEYRPTDDESDVWIAPPDGSLISTWEGYEDFQRVEYVDDAEDFEVPAHRSVLPRYIAFLLALLVVHIARETVMPFVGIAVKWLVIGRYRAGRSRLWGSYYLRWWFVNQTVRFCGLGLFGLSNGLRVRYHRLLGAKIGIDCTIANDAEVTEHDLVIIGDGVAIVSKATVSPFCVDAGAAMLSAIEVGDNCVVGAKTTIAPGARLADGVCLGPLSSSHEQQDSDSNNRRYCRAAFPPPSTRLWLLVGLPTLLFVKVAALALPLATIFYMVQDRGEDPTTWGAAIEWFTSPRRLTFYVLLRVQRAVVLPFVELFAIILVKRIVIGRFVAGPRTRWSHLQFWLMRELLPDGRLCGVPALIGNHWGGVALLMRLLGAKCGKRIFWPGSGVDVVEYDLLTIEDDVVFGSRSVIACSTAEVSRPVTLLRGANVADRCYVLPGVTLGVNGCLGSGSLAPEGAQLGAGCITVGSAGNGTEVLVEGGPGLRANARTTKAFGRTFYGTRNEANIAAGAIENTAAWCCGSFFVRRTVVPLFAAFNVLCIAAAAVYRAFNIVAAWLLLELVWKRDRALGLDPAVLWAPSPPPPISSPPPSSPPPPAFPGDEVEPLPPAEFYGEIEEVGRWLGFSEYWAALLGVYIGVHLLMVMLAYLLEVLAKWLLLGRRRAGVYPWDKSSYCMRWNMYLASTVFRRGLLSYLHGSAYLVWHFKALGCSIGKDVCLFPTGSDPMMTEPDLVTIGDGACINAGFIICHTNTKGNFALSKITIGPGATMRAWSRLMAGGALAEGARLLEHTCALPGDNIEPGVIWQGWPVKSMCATTEFWRARRNQIKLGRKQYLRRVDSTRVAPVIIDGGGKGALALERLDSLQGENLRLKSSIEAVTSRLGATPPMSEDSAPISERGTQIQALVEQVEWLVREMQSLREWRDRVASPRLDHVPLVYDGKGSEGKDSAEKGDGSQRCSPGRLGFRRHAPAPPESQGSDGVDDAV